MLLLLLLFFEVSVAVRNNHNSGKRRIFNPPFPSFISLIRSPFVQNDPIQASNALSVMSTPPLSR